MYQSGRAGEKEKTRKSPAKSGRVGISDNENNLVYDCGCKSYKWWWAGLTADVPLLHYLLRNRTGRQLKYS